MSCSKCGNQDGGAEAGFCEKCGAPITAEAHGTSGGVAGLTRATAVDYACFWRRAGAWLIDSMIGCVFLVLSLSAASIVWDALLEGRARVIFFHSDDEMLLFFGVVGGLLLWWLYYGFLESSRMQATLGKLAVGIVVTDENLERISFWRATGRYFAKIISALVLGQGFVMAGLTNKRQALHDMMTSCLVLDKRPLTSPRQLFRIRKPLAVLPFMVVTVNIYYFVWIYKIHRELQQYLGPKQIISPGLALGLQFVPVFNIIWPIIVLHKVAKSINHVLSDAGSPLRMRPWLVLVLLIVAQFFLVTGAIAAMTEYDGVGVCMLQMILFEWPLWWIATTLIQSGLNNAWRACRLV